MSCIIKGLKLVLVFIFLFCTQRWRSSWTLKYGKHNSKLQTMDNVQESFLHLKLSVMSLKLKLYHAIEVSVTVSFLFSSAIRLTGPFVTMVYSMIVGDMLTFGIIYSVVLFGFSQSFYFLYKGFPGVKTSLYHSYSSTWMALFQITLGDYNVSICLLDKGIMKLCS